MMATLASICMFCRDEVQNASCGWNVKVNWKVKWVLNRLRTKVSSRSYEENECISAKLDYICSVDERTRIEEDIESSFWTQSYANKNRPR